MVVFVVCKRVTLHDLLNDLGGKFERGVEGHFPGVYIN